MRLAVFCALFASSLISGHAAVVGTGCSVERVVTPGLKPVSTHARDERSLLLSCDAVGRTSYTLSLRAVGAEDAIPEVLGGSCEGRCLIDLDLRKAAGTERTAREPRAEVEVTVDF